jgi:hypothetical protein
MKKIVPKTGIYFLVQAPSIFMPTLGFLVKVVEIYYKCENQSILFKYTGFIKNLNLLFFGV